MKKMSLMINAVDFVGFSGAGKTTLVEQLVGIFTQRGYRVGAIKDAHHNVDVDKPGKDTYRFREAGAKKVIVRTEKRWALMVESEKKPSLEELLEEVRDCDLILIEGFKSEIAPSIRLEVWREKDSDVPQIFRKDPTITAVVTDQESIDDCSLPLLDINSPIQVADWIEQKIRR